MMKILHIVICSNEFDYLCDMKTILRSFYHHNSFVDTYFVEYSPDISSEFEISENMITLKGEESLIPGILTKTIDSIELLFSEKYDYVVRSNQSTIIDFYRLREVLESDHNINYLGGQILENTEALQKNSSSRTDPELLGLKFAAGTMICLCRETIKKILTTKDKIRFDLIDDLSIGLFINRFMQHVEVYSLKLSLFTLNVWSLENKEEIYKTMEKLRPVVYRNKSENRFDDCKKMQLISDMLIAYYSHTIIPKLISRNDPIHLHLLR